MTTALPAPAPTSAPAAAPRLRLVGDRPVRPHVGYLVFLPDGVDPVQLLTAHGVRPEIHPLAPRTPPAPAPTPPSPPPVQEGGVLIDQERHVVEVDGRELDLTYLEFSLLAHLVANPHMVHSRESLMARIWGYGHIGDGRTVDVHVARIRRKLGAPYRDRIVTVRRVGYKYVP
ncbi:winged helix-turn-helix domain-containing protein [Streptomyces sp. TRM76323]|uniref:Winged helix-turn-helix domain-containing protein n=1 Tax=Streptomyces tamarix TaxID=3078565 RepID=A0ABU3QIK9_9ACTN|nr:winged helix-turn-helix domain-containing protein [Streptomyces tamarix]MDT9682587.1 winged helix-turn-helix domain-containing protein [Streptomyces tamarix]